MNQAYQNCLIVILNIKKFLSQIEIKNKSSTTNDFNYKSSLIPSDIFQFAKINYFNCFNLNSIVKSFHDDKDFFQDFMFFYSEIDFKHSTPYGIKEGIYNAYIKKLKKIINYFEHSFVLLIKMKIE